MKCTVHSNYSQILHKPLNVKPPQPSYQFLHIFVNYYLIFSSTSRTLGGMTQVVRFQSVRDRKKCVKGPITIQSQSVVGAHVTQSTRPVTG